MFEVYGEYLFLENLLMNWLILYLTATFSKFKVSKARLVTGAAVGALYAFVVFFPSLSFLYSTIMKIIASMLIIIITFIPYHFKDFLKLLAIFYLISFMFGGAAFALFYFTDFNGLVSNGVFYIANFPIRLLLYSGIVSYILLKFCWEYIQVKISRNKVYISIWITVGDQKSKICALIDTGNSLQEPLSKYPVIIVEYEAIKELLPENIQNFFNQSQEVNLDLLSKILQTSDWMNRFRVIPFKSLGKENGMLIGFKPDSVMLEENNEVRSITNIIIGIYTKELSSNGDYRALLHPDVLT
ncbi:sporulation factor SpoIIGA. Unknown type peptidase. MEROPS family U04 [Geosporobacter subterraneus DSM 17957]|uniref:Sporulation sigma-E factor-processing peptidase n=1 Tax=Geosporobacter subterraneus DSM 17957 TaxID=1121919 RepID=A0A1M6GV58_9FIRM|nr:sigma-E processing peptidase SpoIIGA [Geosporobacter subterraneus]SHJ13852.1 sporulation factor SpoIIGA. Unknown type peptidase. MEROPS family U04 [Geosporobacter subterraneus DSM 17957]